jgi:hypothetical protein
MTVSPEAKRGLADLLDLLAVWDDNDALSALATDVACDPIRAVSFVTASASMLRQAVRMIARRGGQDDADALRVFELASRQAFGLGGVGE